MKEYDVIIIGAGTAGLSARREVAKVTDNYLVVEAGKLGTTCARVGCMPSKVIIQVAKDFSRRKRFDEVGIKGGEALSIDLDQVMAHVRILRDRFVGGVISSMKEWEDKLRLKRATFVDSHTLDLEGEQVKGKKIIIATGSRPIIPKPFEPFKNFLWTTDDFFESESLPYSIAVIGLGVIGAELGQALARLGIDVKGFSKGRQIGGISDPVINDYIIKKWEDDFPLHLDGVEVEGISPNNKLLLKSDDQFFEVDKALMAVGRKQTVDLLGLREIGVPFNSRGIPEVDRKTMQIKEFPHLFLPGDANAYRPILHEAADEGKIAGFNAVSEVQCFQHREPLGITFTSPNLAFVGKKHSELTSDKVSFVTGQVSFEGQGRSIVNLQEQGLLHVYADSHSGKILGAEMQAPDGEHIAHLLSWAISLNLTVDETLKLPFYHPVIEEGLRTALRDCASQVKEGPERKLANEVFRCDDPPIR
jgi:dihydrolipoamide dehydrogenase